jgi:hypothetical protein
MTTASAPPVLTTQPSRSFGGGRVVLLVLGIVVLLISLALLAVGGAAVWGLSQRDGSGYFTSGSRPLSTPSYALVSDSFAVGTDAPSWVFDDHFATVQIHVRSSQPVFVGIGHTSDVESYLNGVQHDEIASLNVDPFSVGYSHRGGSARPSPPTGESFWRVKSSGSGTQTISWPLEKGNWSAVVMNADGSHGVAVASRFGARLPFLRWIAIGFLAGGALVLLVGSSLIYLGARSPHATNEAS